MGAALTRVRRLLRARVRRQTRRAVLEGPHLFEEALRAGVPFHDVLVTSAEAVAVRESLARAGRDASVVCEIDERELRSVTDAEAPRGPVAVVDWTEPLRRPFEGPGVWLVLDAVQDPGNVGTLLRSAAAFGVCGVVATRGTADLWSPKVLRAAQGAHFHVPSASESAADLDLMESLTAARAGGAAVWSTAADGQALYATRPGPGSLVVLLGNEARGVSPRLDGQATDRVAVPQTRRAESLNVAMAGTVVLSWLAWTRDEVR